MAGNYIVQYQRQTEELVGGARLRDVVEIGFSTVPSEVYAQTRIDLSFWTADEVAPMLANLADYIETVMGYPYVAGMDYIQDINAAGLLIDVMEITVLSASGKSSATLRQPLALMYPPIVVPLLSALNDRLNAVEAL